MTFILLHSCSFILDIFNDFQNRMFTLNYCQQTLVMFVALAHGSTARKLYEISNIVKTYTWFLKILLQVQFSLRHYMTWWYILRTAFKQVCMSTSSSTTAIVISKIFLTKVYLYVFHIVLQPYTVFLQQM